MYNPGFVTVLNGKDIESAIRDFHSCYNAILFSVYDTHNAIMYESKENENPDERGFINRSFYDGKTLVFNVDELTKPIIQLKPSEINETSFHGYIDREGNFWKCGFEGHIDLANELFVSKTIPEPKSFDTTLSDSSLDNMGWIKISGKRIHSLYQTKFTAKQKKAVLKYMEIIGDKNYEFQHRMMSKYVVEIYMDDKY